MLEIEAKIPVRNHQAVRRRLKKLDAEFIGRYLEANHILDRQDGSLRYAGCGLRVRTMETLQGDPAGPTLTYKGPRLESALKSRQEIELEVADAEALLALLQAIGFETIVSYRKRRERWMLADCHVELDEVPMLGTFVEIEGPDESAVRSVQRSVGLAAAAHEPRSYVHMLAKHCARAARPPIDIDFE